MSAYFVRRVPPSDKMKDVSPSLAPGGRLLSLTGELSLINYRLAPKGEPGTYCPLTSLVVLSLTRGEIRGYSILFELFDILRRALGRRPAKISTSTLCMRSCKPSLQSSLLKRKDGEVTRCSSCWATSIEAAMALLKSSSPSSAAPLPSFFPILSWQPPESIC